VYGDARHLHSFPTRRSSDLPLAPAATLVICCPAGTLTKVWNWRCRLAACSGVMLPPQPHISLPMPKNGTFHGLSRPLARRSSASDEPFSWVMYSTHSAISRGEPLPVLPET